MSILLVKTNSKKIKNLFKDLLDQQFKTAKDYKPKLEWFEGVWTSYKPEKGKDKRGKTGVDQKILSDIGIILSNIPSSVDVHKTIKKIFENKKRKY